MISNRPPIRDQRAIPGQRAIRGFTLIEVLVALIVLGLSMGVIMQIFSAGLDRARRTEARAIAVQLAESKLAAVGIEAPLIEGETSGEFDERFRWRVLVQPYEPVADEPDDGGAGDDKSTGPGPATALVHAYAVKVSVSWADSGRDGDAAAVSLSTIRLVRVE